jgi:hypothetical protein
MTLALNSGSVFEDLNRSFAMRMAYELGKEVNFNFWLITQNTTNNLYYTLKDGANNGK